MLRCISLVQLIAGETFPFFRVITDLDGPKGSYLMGTNEEGSLNIVTLLLTGRYEFVEIQIALQ